MHPSRPMPVQRDLFDPPEEGRPRDMPRWCRLPAATQHRATALLVRMLLDHRRGDVDAQAGWTGGRGDV